MEGQGREGASPERRQVKPRREDKKEGRGASGRVGRMMPASGRTMKEDSRQEKPEACMS